MLNLRVNYPSVPSELELFHAYTAEFPRRSEFDLLHPPAYSLQERDEATLLQFLGVDMDAVKATSVITTIPSANSALYCVMAVLHKGLQVVATEEFTFPGFKMIANHYNVPLATVACDEEGMIPSALAAFLEAGTCKLVYLQPTIHNPTCAVMSLERRQAIAEVVASFEDVYILEDDAYRFLHPSPPPTFLSIIPSRTVHILSLSKAYNPFLKAAYIIYPTKLLQGLENYIRLTSSSPCSLFIDFGIHLLQGGRLQKIMAEKQAVAKDWQDQIRKVMKRVPYATHPNSFHFWIMLPQGNSSSTITSYLRTEGMDIPDGVDFAVNGQENYMRVALGTEWQSPELLPAMEKLAACILGNN
ncbi:aminotransferase class I and II [Chitinophaga skermanii]|uniref:Aminotransferase class I and II n=1 Tax=Chitinophaga skermanii TaxID=331697 RepID=A0A327QNB1_9BACT|nr:PLP-dependent aminotransferase family protein [Chitinophaga skermanii]RAJ05375.1 aminotransferase class I and II [Chitinophaga skermanii]